MTSLIRWALDEAHATTALTKMAEEAGDEVGRSTLFAKGALQIATGLLLAWPASALVQHAGCGALSAICSSGSRETRGTIAMMRLLQVCALMTF